jgi:hypothetical protein
MDEAGSTGFYEVLLVLRGFIGLGEVLLGSARLIVKRVAFLLRA